MEGRTEEGEEGERVGVLPVMAMEEGITVGVSMVLGGMGEGKAYVAGKARKDCIVKPL
jgi:hypothetical protein